MGCGVLCAVDPHAVGAWGVGSAVGITPNGPSRSIAFVDRVVGSTVLWMARSASSTVDHQSVRSDGWGMGLPGAVSGVKLPRKTFLVLYVKCVSSV